MTPCMERVYSARAANTSCMEASEAVVHFFGQIPCLRTIQQYGQYEPDINNLLGVKAYVSRREEALP